MSKRLIVLTGLIAIALLLTGCFGPSPEVLEKHLTPPQAGEQTYVVDAVVTNNGLGAGQVTVEASLTNKKNGNILAQDNKQVDIDPGGKIHVVFNLDMPPSVGNISPDDVEMDVQASYPD